MRMPPGCVGHHIQIGQCRVRDMIDRGQHQALPHRLNGEGRLNGS